MEQYLCKYLVLYKHLCIPQLGSFTIQRSAARFDESAGILYPPTENIVFSDGVVPMSEKLFFDFLASETGTDEVSAIKQFNDFCFDFRNRLSQAGAAEIKGVGRLTSGENGHFQFEEAPRLTDLFPTLSLDGSVADVTDEIAEEENLEEEKDEWWIYALVLFILGAGALVLYYFS